ncbi:MAG: CPBP family intramembrane glutamic endopeptidase [Nonlabens sp.]
MYIEQGYKGDLGAWNFIVIPVLFILFMAVNYVFALSLADQGKSVEESMQAMINSMGKLPFLVFNLLVFAVGLAAVFLWTKYINRQSITSLTTSRRHIDCKRVFFMFVFWGVLSLSMILLGVYLEPESFVFNLDWGRFIPLLIVVVLLIPIQTSFEEYLFRGQFMQGLGIATGTRWVPFIVTSVMFGLMHGANPEVEKLGWEVMIFYIGTGFLLGAMTLLDEGLELALGFHAANNMVAALMVTSTWTALQTDSAYLDISEPSFSWTDVLPIVIGYPIILLILGRVYKWKNWGSKLFGKVMSEEEFYSFENTPQQETAI